MRTVSATEFVNNFGRRNQEVQREPIEVKSHGRTVGYYISAQDYEALQVRKAKSWRFRDMPKSMRDALLESLRRIGAGVQGNEAVLDDVALEFGASVPSAVRERLDDAINYKSIRGAILARRDEIKALGARYKAARIRLFGSVARGEDTLDSDIDLLVDFDQSYDPFADRFALANALEDMLGRKVDLIVEAEMKTGISALALADAVEL